MRANEALAEARQTFPAGQASHAFSWEIVVPENADQEWFEERLLAHLVYHCESTRAQLPECAGVFVSMFVGEKLYCVSAQSVIAFARELLSVDDRALVERFGTGEVRHALEPAPEGELIALPGVRNEKS